MRPSIERLAHVALSRVLEPGDLAAHQALDAHGPAELWSRLARAVRVPELSEAAEVGARGRVVGLDPEQDWRLMQHCGARLVLPGDEDWPPGLSWSGLRAAPPRALYLRGPGSLQALVRSVAVVGARAATAYGEHVARELGLGLADSGWWVVSGGAYGIDGAAHRGALTAAEPRTVAVLAGGLDVVYPRGHDRLLAGVAERGLLVSELPPGSAPTRLRFLVRNRLIAALSVGTVVVEAARRSGSLSTAGWAVDLSRRLMAVPGPVTSAQSVGCHHLLRERDAVCVTSAAEVLEAVGAAGEHLLEPSTGPSTARDELPETVRRVLDAVPVRAPAGEASIARTAGVSALVVQQVLPPLLVHGLVERRQGGWRLTALGAGRQIST